MNNQVIQKFESKFLKKELPAFRVGDGVRVHMRIIEGQKERVQVFQGTVIARKGSGLSETFSVYRNAHGSSMERVFLLHSPKIAKIEVVRTGKVRQAKLYYIRGRSGKSAKVKEQIGAKAIKTVTEPASEKEVMAEVAEAKTEEPKEELVKEEKIPEAQAKPTTEKKAETPKEEKKTKPKEENKKDSKEEK